MCPKAIGLGSVTEKQTNLTAALTALWFMCPLTPPSSNVMICRVALSALSEGRLAFLGATGPRTGTNSINVPFPHVLMHKPFDELSVPPLSGVILEVRMVKGNAAIRRDAECCTRAGELSFPGVSFAVVVAYQYQRSVCQHRGPSMARFGDFLEKHTCGHDQQSTSHPLVPIKNSENAGREE